MTQLAQYTELSDMIGQTQSYQAEVDTITRFYAASTLLREVAMYRLYRMYINRDWTDNFANASDFVTSMGNNMGVSARIIYERIKVYDVFAWLGVHAETAIRKTTDNPYLYSQIFKALVQHWDLDSHMPTTVAIPGIDEPNSDVTKQKLLDIIDTSEKFDKQHEAIDNIKANILGAPVIKLYMPDDDDAIHCDFEFGSIDANGQRTIEDYGHVVWLPDNDAPKEVIETLRRRIRKQ